VGVGFSIAKSLTSMIIKLHNFYFKRISLN